MTYSLYISGPMTGLPDFNFPAFDRVAEFLTSAGFTPISPAEHDREVLRRSFDAGDTVYRFVHNVPGYSTGDVQAYQLGVGSVHDLLVWDIAQIVQVDAIVLLPGWENSTGAAHERYVAEATNKRIFLAEFHDDGSCSIHADDEPVRLTKRPKYVDKQAADILFEDAVRSAEDHLRSCDAQLVESDQLPEVRFVQDAREIRLVNASTGGAKGSKLARFDLLPVRPMWAVAEHYGLGAQKYAARNWELGYEWSLSFAAMMRHALSFWNGEDNDPELGTPHLAAVVFHAFSLMEWGRTHPELDDRPSAA